MGDDRRVSARRRRASKPSTPPPARVGDGSGVREARVVERPSARRSAPPPPAPLVDRPEPPPPGARPSAARRRPSRPPSAPPPAPVETAPASPDEVEEAVEALERSLEVLLEADGDATSGARDRATEALAGLLGRLRRRDAGLLSSARALAEGRALLPEPAGALGPSLLGAVRRRLVRLTLDGGASLPEGPALLVAEAFGSPPWNGIALRDHLAAQAGRAAHWLVDDGLLRAPVLGALLSRWGGVPASVEAADALLADGAWLLTFASPARRVGARRRAGARTLDRLVASACTAGAPVVPLAVAAEPGAVEAPAWRALGQRLAERLVGPPTAIGALSAVPGRWRVTVRAPIATAGASEATVLEALRA